MRMIIQRVKNASVTVENKLISKIETGLLIFLGVGEGDTKEIADKLLYKVIRLRIFSDENNKTNLSIQDVAGELMIISQFTLYADCKKGNRPSFTNAGNPKLANELYEHMIEQAKKHLGKVSSGIFGADMKVELNNDGPFTIILDSKDLI